MQKAFSKIRGVYFLFNPQKYGQITGWRKNFLKGDKKGGKMHFFPQFIKSIHIFSPYDLKYKIAKLSLENITPKGPKVSSWTVIRLMTPFRLEVDPLRLNQSINQSINLYA